MGEIYFVGISIVIFFIIFSNILVSDYYNFIVPLQNVNIDYETIHFDYLPINAIPIVFIDKITYIDDQTILTWR